MQCAFSDQLNVGCGLVVVSVPHSHEWGWVQVWRKAHPGIALRLGCNCQCYSRGHLGWKKERSFDLITDAVMAPTLRHVVFACACTLLNLPVSWSMKAADDYGSEANSSIPRIIWTTGRWAKESNEMKKALDNLQPGLNFYEHDQVAEQEQERLAGQRKAEQAFLAWAPPGTEVRYIDNAGMDSMTKEIAKELESEGVQDILNAYQSVRPGSFKADIWRLLTLWSHGGVYVDVNIQMKAKFTQFIDFEKDKMVLVSDSGMPPQCRKHGPAYWNAIMVSSPRNKYILASIKGVVENIKRHSYEWCYFTDITGPSALGNIIDIMPNYTQDIRMEYEWHNPGVRKIGDDAPGWMDRRICNKDESLHDITKDKHYVFLWGSRQIYCDEKGPDGNFC